MRKTFYIFLALYLCITGYDALINISRHHRDLAYAREREQAIQRSKQRARDLKSRAPQSESTTRWL
jgi:hypothetical protein